METSGRERRHRYYTIAAYRKLVSQENLDPMVAGYADTDLKNVGEFANLDSAAFYEDEAALTEYQDVYKVEATSSGGAKKKKAPKNPILPDGSVKLGRPRKHPVKGADGETPSTRAGKKRKADDTQISNIAGPAVKKRRTEEDTTEPVASKGDSDFQKYPLI
jgi:transcription factor C subunit 3